MLRSLYPRFSIRFLHRSLTFLLTLFLHESFSHRRVDNFLLLQFGFHLLLFSNLSFHVQLICHLIFIKLIVRPHTGIQLVIGLGAECTILECTQNPLLLLMQ